MIRGRGECKDLIFISGRYLFYGQNGVSLTKVKFSKISAASPLYTLYTNLRILFKLLHPIA